MDDLTRISSTEFSREVSRFQDLALTQAVVITRNGRDRTVMISAIEYDRLTQGDRRAEAGSEPLAHPVPKVAHSRAGGRVLDDDTRRAAESFAARIEPMCKSARLLVYGSRARGTHSAESDADIAVILKGKPKDRHSVLGPLADAAYDVLMETGIYIQPLPLWESELKRPEQFSNPALLDAIRREGVRL